MAPPTKRMAFTSQSGSSSHGFQSTNHPNYGNSLLFENRATTPQFDILEWYPQFQSCHRYFLDVAQHSGPVQALAAFINIQLPFQKSNPVISSNPISPRLVDPNINNHHLRQQPPFHASAAHPQAASLIPYIRRLIVTGHDSPGVLHGFFGDDWVGGIGDLHEVERRNYLFAAKSTSWLKVKQAYDMSPEETVPFLKPMGNASEKEIQSAEATWSDWLAMQDWMLGPRAPDGMNRSPRVKREPQD